MDPVAAAEAIYSVYQQGFAFPSWSVEMLKSGELDDYARSVTVYYRSGDDVEDVKRMATEREPVNIAMGRRYNEHQLQQHFGYSRGAYQRSTETHLMPNIAIYCRTPIRGTGAQKARVHVINVVGYAFDSTSQPDYKYFFPLAANSDKWHELVDRMQQVWRFAFECARRKSLKRVFLADVGGGAFSTYLERASPGYAALKRASLPPVMEEYKDIVEVRQLPRIPDWVFSEEGQRLLEDSLLMNAWDPWSMVGNGNAADNSLDGFWGRCTAMAVLCWPKTNTQMQWESVGPPH